MMIFIHCPSNNAASIPVREMTEKPVMAAGLPAKPD